MNLGRAVLDTNYFNPEVYLNNIKKVSINNGTEYAIGVAIVDSSGNNVSPTPLSFHSDGSSALTDTQVAAAPGLGIQIVVTSIIFSTGAATACNIFFEEGSTKVLGPWYLEATAGRGVVWEGAKPITANTALTVTTSASIAQGLDVCYYLRTV